MNEQPQNNQNNPYLAQPQGPGASTTSSPAFVGVAVYPPPGTMPGASYNTPLFSDSPVQTTCRNCNTSVMTRVSYKSGLMTWLIAGGICLFGGVCGCCLIPFFVNACKDIEHYCPNCNALIGKRDRFN